MINVITETSCKLKEPRTQLAILAKATEELGEVATMINKPNKEYKETIQEECCDVINAVVDLAWVDFRAKHHEMSEETCRNLFADLMMQYQKNKLAKWYKNYKRWGE